MNVASRFRLARLSRRGGLAAALALCLLPGAAGALLQEPEKAQEPAPMAAAPRGKKLYLKDGTFHVVRSYEQKGDRVRFYSVERSMWEEIPEALVDWEATRAAEEAERRRDQELKEKAVATEAAARAAELDVDASIEVAPGAFLPDGEGLYLVDGKTIVPMASVGTDTKLDKGRLLTQVLVPIPVVPTRHRVRIPGKKAALRVSTTQPEFYIRTADAREPEIEFIRAQVKKDAREIQVVDTDLVGDQWRKGNTLSVQRWKVARGVYRLTLAEPLAPGEYAVAEFLPGEGLSFYVWDFGVDAAPAASRPDGSGFGPR